MDFLTQRKDSLPIFTQCCVAKQHGLHPHPERSSLDFQPARNPEGDDDSASDFGKTFQSLFFHIITIILCY